MTVTTPGHVGGLPNMRGLRGKIASRCDTGTFTVTYGQYEPETHIPRHDHEHASLCIALSGGYEEQLDRHSRRIETGTLVIHPEGEAHANHHAPRVTDLLTIELSPAALGLAREISPRFDESWHRPALFLLPAAYRILHEIETVRSAGTLAVDDLIWRVIGETTDHRETDSARPAWLLLVRDYLDAHFTDAPTLTMLAGMAGVHSVHLTRSFRTAYGCSVGDFVRQRQVETALSLLAEGELGLGQISLAAGFADQSHMTRRVGALTGKPPGTWRRRLQRY